MIDASRYPSEDPAPLYDRRVRVAAAANALGASAGRVKRLVQTGQLAGGKTPGRRGWWFVWRSALDERTWGRLRDL